MVNLLVTKAGLRASMIYVNGDSWSFRSKECNFDIWPDIVSKELNQDISNDSVGCGSNSRILDNIQYRFLTEDPKIYDLILIGLTSHHRIHLPSAEFNSWSTGPIIAIHDKDGKSDDNFKKFYFSKCYDEIGSVYRYFRDIWQISEISKKFNSRCIFFQMWDIDLSKHALLTSDENIHNFVSRYYNQDSWYYQKYVKAFTNLKKLSEDWEYYETVPKLLPADLDCTLHPNALGHQKIDNYILSKI